MKHQNVENFHIDTQPLEAWEYELILPQLEYHWRLLARVLWECGVRISEALAIQRSDLENGGVWVTRKKRSDHPRDHIPLTADLFCRLRLVSIQHKSARLFPFTASAFWDALKRACRRAGVRATIHPHSFRHGFGFRAARSELTGRSALEQLATLQQMMGHVSIKSTLVYLKATERELKANFQKLNR